MSDFDKFLFEWRNACEKYPQLRTGQAASNVLHALHPEISREVEHKADPFYDNSKLPAFLMEVVERLQNVHTVPTVSKEEGDSATV